MPEASPHYIAKYYHRHARRMCRMPNSAIQIQVSAVLNQIVCSSHRIVRSLCLLTPRSCSLQCYKTHKSTHPQTENSTLDTGEADTDVSQSATSTDPAKTAPVFEQPRLRHSTFRAQKQPFDSFDTDARLQRLIRNDRLRLQLQSIYGLTLEASLGSRSRRGGYADRGGRGGRGRGRGGRGGRGDFHGGGSGGSWTQGKGDAEALERLRMLRDGAGCEVDEFVKLVALWREEQTADNLR